MKKSLKQQAYDAIKQKIMLCEYYPNSFINESILQSDMGLSRTPMRDALSRLEQENLVRIIPKKGIMVTELSIRDIHILFETRNLIETYAVRNYGSQIDHQQLRHWRNVFSKKMETNHIDSLETDAIPNTYNPLYVLDHEFHLFLVHTCQNDYFDRMMESIRVQNARLRMIIKIKIANRMPHTLSEHLEIIDFILDGDYASAEKAITAHLNNAKQASFSALIENEGVIG